jgi:hypothetical protein
LTALLRPQEQPVLMGEVLEVPTVEGDQRKVVGDTAGGDPAVVDRSRAPASLRRSDHSCPRRGYEPIAGEDGDRAEPATQLVAPALAPGAHLSPLHQLSDGHEADDEGGADESVCHVVGECLALESRRDVRVDDERRHDESGEVGVTAGADGGEKGVEFLVGFPDVSGVVVEVLERGHRFRAGGRYESVDSEVGRHCGLVEV